MAIRDEGGVLHGIRRLVPLVLILASACSGGSPDPSDESDPLSSAFSITDALQPDRPRRGVAFTDHVDREDPKVRPTFAFTTQDTEVTAVPIDNVPSVAHVEYQVLGEETAGGFTLRFALAASGFSSGATYAGFFSLFGVPASPSGGPSVAVGVSGTSGTGQGMWQFRSGNPPATYSANGTITLECVASCEPAS